MSVRTRSLGVLLRRFSASRPLAASPTTTNGSALAQSSSSSRSRRLAGASSSTTTTLSAASLMRHLGSGCAAVRHSYVHFVSILVHPALQTCLCVEVQRQPLANIGQRHLVPGVMTARHLIRVTQYGVHLTPAQEDINRDDPRCARR